MTMRTPTESVSYAQQEPYDCCPEYPCTDGEPMAESDFQATAMTDVFGALRALYRDRADTYVAIDMFVYYRRGDSGSRVAPDMFVVTEADGSHPRHSWRIWEEGGKPPSLVLEVASGSTWVRDAEEKRDIYAQMGAVEYWRFDPERGKFLPSLLIGERLVNDEYQPIDAVTDEQGILRAYSEVLGLDICVVDGTRLRLYDPASGTWLRGNLAEAEDHIARETTARQEAEAENQRLRALLSEFQGAQPDQ